MQMSGLDREFLRIGCAILLISWCRSGTAFLIATAFASTVLAQTKEKSPVGRFEAEIPLRWNAVVLPNVHKLQCSCVFTQTNKLKHNKISQKTHEEYKLSKSFFLHRLEHEFPPEDIPTYPPYGESFVFAWNSRYRFTVTGRPGKPAWRVKEIKHWFPDSVDESGADSARIIELSEPLDHFRLWNFPIPNLVAGKEGKFAIQSAREDPKDPSLVRIDFDLAHYIETVPMAGWAKLDGKACWCVRSYDITRRWPAYQMRWRGQNEYRVTKDGFPVLEKVSRHSTCWNEEEKLHDLELVWEFSNQQFRDNIPESEFRLTAFGFPEPPGFAEGTPGSGQSQTLSLQSESDQSLWLWIVIAAGTCIVIALVLGALARRRTVAKA